MCKAVKFLFTLSRESNSATSIKFDVFFTFSSSSLQSAHQVEKKIKVTGFEWFERIELN